MPPKKSIRFVLSFVAGMLMAGLFVSAHGGLKVFLSLSEKVSWLHYWYGLILIVAFFWIGFVGTWALYSALLWIVNRHFYNSGHKNV